MTTIVPYRTPAERESIRLAKPKRIGRRTRRKLALKAAKPVEIPIEVPSAPYRRWDSRQRDIVRMLIAKRDGGWRCHWCQHQLFEEADRQSKFFPTIDHLVRQCDGGDSGLDNLVLACRLCNSQRHNKPLHPWYRDQPPTL